MCVAWWRVEVVGTSKRTVISVTNVSTSNKSRHADWTKNSSPPLSTHNRDLVIHYWTQRIVGRDDAQLHYVSCFPCSSSARSSWQLQLPDFTSEQAREIQRQGRERETSFQIATPNTRNHTKFSSILTTSSLPSDAPLAAPKSHGDSSGESAMHEHTPRIPIRSCPTTPHLPPPSLHLLVD